MSPLDVAVFLLIALGLVICALVVIDSIVFAPLKRRRKRNNYRKQVEAVRLHNEKLAAGIAEEAARIRAIEENDPKRQTALREAAYRRRERRREQWRRSEIENSETLTKAKEAELEKESERRRALLAKGRRAQIVEGLRTMDYQEYLKTPYWQARRTAVLESAGHQCERCGAQGVQMDVHHLDYSRLGAEWQEDLEALCRSCHREEHGLPQSADPIVRNSITDNPETPLEMAKRIFDKESAKGF